MDTKDLDILIRSPTAFSILYSREVCGFGRSQALASPQTVTYQPIKKGRATQRLANQKIALLYLGKI